MSARFILPLGHDLCTLAVLRDALLPKPISGELRIQEAMACWQEERDTMESQL